MAKSINSTTVELTGKEYLDKEAKEKEKKRDEEVIKAQQKISEGNPAYSGY
ncbi:hypothetical protein [Lactococcus muris]